MAPHYSRLFWTSHGEMSDVESGVTGNLWKAVPVPQGTHQGGTCGYHRLPAADWPASGQRQCIAGVATQQQQQQQQQRRTDVRSGRELTTRQRLCRDMPTPDRCTLSHEPWPINLQPLTWKSSVSSLCVFAIPKMSQ